MSGLPKNVVEMARVIGLPETLRVVDKFGGTRLNINKLKPNAELVDLLGFALAERFVGAFGGEHLDVPVCAAMLRAQRNRTIAEEKGAGAGADELARKYQLTERTIWRILQNMGDETSLDEPIARDDRQMCLFKLSA